MGKDNQLPKKIQELLDKKGWTWPPDDKLKAQWDAASQRLFGSLRVDNEEEFLELFDGVRGMERVCEEIKLRRKTS